MNKVLLFLVLLIIFGVSTLSVNTTVYAATVAANISVKIKYPDLSTAPIVGAEIKYWATTSQGWLLQDSAITDASGVINPYLVSCQGQAHLELQVPANLPAGGTWSTSVRRPGGAGDVTHIGFIDIDKNPADQDSYEPFERGGDPTDLATYQQITGIKSSPDSILDTSNIRSVATGILNNHAVNIWIDWVYVLPADTTPPVCTNPTFAPHLTNPNKISITSSATDKGVGLNRFGLYVVGNGAIRANDVTFPAVASKTLSYDWDITGLADGTYTIQSNWWDATTTIVNVLAGHPGNFSQCNATYTINTVVNQVPVCQTPIITPSGNITTSFSATATATDDKGIKKTGIYIYKKSPRAHVREIQSNTTVNTNTTVTTSWDLKDDVGNVVSDGNYEIYYNWYDVEGAMAQCKTDFTKTTPPQDAIYSCSTGVTPSSFEFIPSQSKPLSIAITSNTASSINIRWSDSCGLGTFDLLNVSALDKTYSLALGVNTLRVDWKAKPGNPVVAPGCKVQANVISTNPAPTIGTLPVCTNASVTAVTANQVTWSGKAILGDLDCPANASSSLWNTNPGLENVNVNIGGISSLTNSSGNYSITKEFFGATITENVYASKSGDYYFICYKNQDTVKLKAGANWNKETFSPGNYNIVPYFKFAPPAFITANNGEVYSGYKVILNKPSVTNPTYFQTSGSNTLGGLVLSKGDISSAWSDKTTEKYSKQGLTNYGLDYQSLLLRIVTEIDNGRYDISGQDIVYIDHDLNITASDLISNNDYKKKVLIVKGSVVITDSDNFGSDKIQTYIMATGDISFVSSVAKPVNTLKMLGGVFSSGVIKFDREKSVLSDGYKDPTIKFDLDASLYVRDNLEALKVANIKWRELL